jgi:DUF4097 and DUF4098 domain-containing protein YvlB
MERHAFATPDGVDLDVHIPSGRIDIVTSEATDTTVEVDGTRNPDDVRVELRDRPGGRSLVRIESRKKISFGWSTGAGIRVRIAAPVGCGVTAVTGSADLSAEGTVGAIDFRSGSGDLQFDQALGDVTVKVASGDVHGHRVAGEVSVASASGDVELETIEGPADGRTASGDIRIVSAGGSVHASSASGDIVIESISTGTVDGRTMSGDITVGVAPGTHVWLDLSSANGEARSDLEPSDGPPGEVPPVELRLSSMSGDVRVRRAGALTV